MDSESAARPADPTQPHGAPAAAEPAPRRLTEEVFEICVQKGGYPDRWKVLGACPACDSTRRDFCFTKYGFGHVRCRDCGLVSLERIPPDDVVEALYRGEYYSRVRELFELPRLKAGKGATPFTAPESVLVEVIQNVARGRASGVWLDAGGGIGAFADLISRSLPDWRVVLNDRNPRSLEIARDVLALETTVDDPATLYRSGRRFAVVSAIAVLEHVPNPLEFLLAYGKLLEPGGTLVIVVPHFTRLSALVSGGSSPMAAPPFHVNLFNRESLVRLIQRCGLFEDPTTYDRGEPAFSLMHHVDFSEYFDITIPTPEDPEPRTIMVKPYEPETSNRINLLSTANESMKALFAETDGRDHLVALAVRLGETGGRA